MSPSHQIRVRQFNCTHTNIIRGYDMTKKIEWCQVCGKQWITLQDHEPVEQSQVEDKSELPSLDQTKVPEPE